LPNARRSDPYVRLSRIPSRVPDLEALVWSRVEDRGVGLDAAGATCARGEGAGLAAGADGLACGWAAAVGASRTAMDATRSAKVPMLLLIPRTSPRKSYPQISSKSLKSVKRGGAR
jgi:hypothetical protein